MRHPTTMKMSAIPPLPLVEDPADLWRGSRGPQVGVNTLGVTTSSVNRLAVSEEVGDLTKYFKLF
jgi:hypothetical protein